MGRIGRAAHRGQSRRQRHVGRGLPRGSGATGSARHHVHRAAGWSRGSGRVDRRTPLHRHDVGAVRSARGFVHRELGHEPGGGRARRRAHGSDPGHDSRRLDRERQRVHRGADHPVVRAGRGRDRPDRLDPGAELHPRHGRDVRRRRGRVRCRERHADPRARSRRGAGGRPHLRRQHRRCRDLRPLPPQAPGAGRSQPGMGRLRRRGRPGPDVRVRRERRRPVHARRLVRRPVPRDAVPGGVGRAAVRIQDRRAARLVAVRRRPVPGIGPQRGFQLHGWSVHMHRLDRRTGGGRPEAARVAACP